VPWGFTDITSVYMVTFPEREMVADTRNLEATKVSNEENQEAD